MFKLNWLGGGRTPKIKPNAKAKVVDVVDEIAFEKKVGILHIMCTIASTLMVAIIFQQIIGATFVPLKDMSVALIVAAVYSGTVYSFRLLQKSGTCYMFQLTLAGTAGLTQYIATTHDYRLMALGTFIVLMFQNNCIDRHLLKAGKIDNSLYNIRVAMCAVLVVLGIGGYGYSFRFFPDSCGSPSLIADENRDESSYSQHDDQNAYSEENFTTPQVVSLLEIDLDTLSGICRTGREIDSTGNLDGQAICEYPHEWVDQLKEFENAPLFKGTEVKSKVHKDKLRPDVAEVGYGVTAGEIADAKHYGFLPKDAELPKSLTKEEADRWMEEVTLPTYDAMVCDKVKVDLTPQQRFALLSFCHNTGGGSLDKLALYKNRLNSGNLACAPAIMRLYVNAGRHTNVSGLVKRRNWEANLFAESLGEIASN